MVAQSSLLVQVAPAATRSVHMPFEQRSASRQGMVALHVAPVIAFAVQTSRPAVFVVQ